MEFVKFGCKNDKCHFCRTWSGIPVQRIPQPGPDTLRPGHYQNVSTTLSHENGDEREVDDWQPRANEEYDWMELVLKGELGKLTVLELNKYLTKHNLKMKGRKAEKINAITADVLRRNQPNVIETALRRVEPSVEEEEGEEEGEEEEESDEDLVIGEIEADSTCDSGSEEENEIFMNGPLPLIVRTRYGRYAGHWNLFKLI